LIFLACCFLICGHLYCICIFDFCFLICVYACRLVFRGLITFFFYGRLCFLCGDLVVLVIFAFSGMLALFFFDCQRSFVLSLNYSFWDMFDFLLSVYCCVCPSGFFAFGGAGVGRSLFPGLVGSRRGLSFCFFFFFKFSCFWGRSSFVFFVFFC